MPKAKRDLKKFPMPSKEEEILNILTTVLTLQLSERGNDHSITDLVEMDKKFSEMWAMVINIMTQGGKNEGKTWVKDFEEIIIKSVDVLSLLFSPLNKAKPEDNFTLKSRIGHIIYILLDISLNTGNKQLCVKSIATVRLVMEKIDNKLDILINILPGTFSKLTRLCVGDFKRGSRIVTISLSTLQVLLMKVLADEMNTSCGIDESDNPADAFFKLVNPESKPRYPIPIPSLQKKGAPPPIQRNSSWLKETRDRISPLLEKVLVATRIKSKSNVKLALLSLCMNIVIHMSKSLPSCVPLSLETAFLLSFDEDPLVCGESENVIEKISLSTSNVELFKSIQDKLYSALISLVHVSKRGEENIRSTLQLICGYCKILKTCEDAPLFLDCIKVLSSLSVLFTLDVAHTQGFVMVLESKGVIGPDSEEKQIDQYYRKYYTYMKENSIISLAQNCLELIGSTPSLFLPLFSNTLQLLSLRSITPHPCSLLQILLLLLKGNNGKLYAKQVSLYLISSYIWEEKDAEENNLSPLQAKDKMWTLALALETMGVAIDVLGKTVKSLLVHILYPIMVKSASEHPLIQQAAMTSLLRINAAMSYSGLPALVAENMDYIVLDNIQQHPSVPSLLSFVWRLSGSSSLPLLKDTCQSICCSLDDTSLNSSNIKGLLGVAIEIVNALKDNKVKVEAELESKERDNNVEKNEEQSEKEFISWLSDALQLLEPLHALTGESEDSSFIYTPDREEEDYVEDNKEKDEESWKAKEGSKEAIALDLMEKASFFLSNPDVFVKQEALSVIYLGVDVPKQAVLLPLLNRIWSAFVHRLKDSDTSVILRALSLLSALAMHSGTFLSRRFEVDVQPILINLLQKEKTKGKDGVLYISKDELSHLQINKAQTSIRHQSASYKILFHLLQTLTTLSIHTPSLILKHTRLWAASTLFLFKHEEDKFDAGIHESAITLWKEFIKLDVDSIWDFLSNSKLNHSHTIMNKAVFKVLDTFERRKKWRLNERERANKDVKRNNIEYDFDILFDFARTVGHENVGWRAC